MEKQKVSVIAVIQARMTSSRFPGKVMAPLNGRPIFGHIVSRLAKSKYDLSIVLATSINSEEEALIEYAKSLAVEVVRGPEDNVLERYRLIRDQYEFDYIVSICGDSPFVEASCVDYILDEMIQTGADYAKLKEGTICIHEGIDPISKKGIDKLLDEVSGDPVAQEHVNGYFHKHPSFCRSCDLVFPIEEQVKVRLSVDTPADLKFLEALYANSSYDDCDMPITMVPVLLEANPALRDINSYVRQKSVDHKEVRVLIRCDGGHGIGWGHIIRCLSIADELRDQCKAFVQFLTYGDEAVYSHIRSKSFRVQELDNSIDESKQIESICSALNIDVLFLDIRTDLARAKLEQLKECVQRLVVFDDSSERRLAADMAIYPPAPQVKSLDWLGYAGELIHGWDMVPLRNEFYKTKLSEKRDRIFISFGASDPEGMTLQLLNGLNRVGLLESLSFDVLLGPSCSDKDKIIDFSRKYNSTLSLHIGRVDVWNIMKSARAAICAFGTTCYELAALGIPQLIVSRSEDDFLHAKVFEEEDLGIVLGRYELIDFQSDFKKIIQWTKQEHKRIEKHKMTNNSGGLLIAEALLKGLTTNIR